MLEFSLPYNISVEICLSLLSTLFGKRIEFSAREPNIAYLGAIRAFFVEAEIFGKDLLRLWPKIFVFPTTLYN